MEYSQNKLVYELIIDKDVPCVSVEAISQFPDEREVLLSHKIKYSKDYIISQKVELENDMNYNSIFNPENISEKRWYDIKTFNVTVDKSFLTMYS